jgi:AcrR family transcriptional regulator
MDDIAKELGMSKKTIYHHFKEKDDLVNTLCDTEMIKHEQIFDELFNESKNPIHEMMLISANMRKMMQHINPIFFLDLQKFHPQALNRFQEFKQNCAFKHIERNITKGIEAGFYRKDIDVEFTAKYRLSQLDMLLFGNYYSFEKISFTKSHELLLDMFVYGICTANGHQLLNEYKKV